MPRPTPSPSVPSPTPTAGPTQERRLNGLYWDTSFALLAGVRLRASPVPTAAGQLRLGGLYGHDPWSLHLGVVAALGGYAEVGGGAEIEFNHLDGFFAAGTLAFSLDGHGVWAARAGYWMVGLAYERPFDAFSAAQGAGWGALYAVLRFPLGLAKAVEDASQQALSSRLAAVPPQRAAAPARDPALARQALVRAERAQVRGEWSIAEQALRQAFEADPQLATLAQWVGLCEARERPVQAAAALAAALKNPRLRLTTAQRKAWQQRLHGLRQGIPVLRLDPRGFSADARFVIDGEPCPGVHQGYDCPLNPGDHILEVWEGVADTPRLHRFSVTAGGIARLSLQDMDGPASAAP